MLELIGLAFLIAFLFLVFVFKSTFWLAEVIFKLGINILKALPVIVIIALLFFFL